MNTYTKQLTQGEAHKIKEFAIKTKTEIVAFCPDYKGDDHDPDKDDLRVWDLGEIYQDMNSSLFIKEEDYENVLKNTAFYWEHANFPFSTGIYNGLDYVSRGYYKHIMENFGRYEEHATANLNCYEFRSDILRLVEDKYKASLKFWEDAFKVVKNIPDPDKTPEKEKSVETNKLVRLNQTHLDWIRTNKDEVFTYFFLNGQEVAIKGKVLSLNAEKNRIEITRDHFVNFPKEFQDLSEKEFKNEDNDKNVLESRLEIQTDFFDIKTQLAETQLENWKIKKELDELKQEFNKLLNLSKDDSLSENIIRSQEKRRDRLAYELQKFQLKT